MMAQSTFPSSWYTLCSWPQEMTNLCSISIMDYDKNIKERKWFSRLVWAYCTWLAYEGRKEFNIDLSPTSYLRKNTWLSSSSRVKNTYNLAALHNYNYYLPQYTPRQSFQPFPWVKGVKGWGILGRQKYKPALLLSTLTTNLIIKLQIISSCL